MKGKDIILRDEGHVFSFRSAGAAIYDGRILLQAPVGTTEHVLPGSVRPLAKQAGKHWFVDGWKNWVYILPLSEYCGA